MSAPISFDMAREIIDAVERPEWEGPGTYYVAPWGSENAEEYLLITGARESIVDKDPRYLLLGEELPFVNRATGKVIYRVQLPDPETAAILDTMTPIGPVPSDER
ncbi:MAG: hypothetical protein V9E85_04390 [Candidatus Nanopelagicales bacterium]|jgi:hypothetical protein